MKVGRNKPSNEFSKLNVGAWLYTQESKHLIDSSNATRNAGVYLGYQHYIPLPSAEKRLINIWGRIGFANASVNRLGTSLTGGILFQGIFSDDLGGLAFTSAVNGGPYRSLESTASLAETAIELTYTNFLFNNITIQPDIQYIIRPNAKASILNALSCSLLIQMSFQL